jgi:hypothetical protein
LEGFGYFIEDGHQCSPVDGRMRLRLGPGAKVEHDAIPKNHSLALLRGFLE